jgi:DNA-binding transcriptional ArsR family regulator
LTSGAKSPVHPIDQKLIRAIAHPLRVCILEMLQGKSESATGISKKVNVSLNLVAYHLKVLEECGCIKEVGNRRRRGATERFHTALPRSFIGHQDWRRAPLSVRGGVTNEALRTFVAKIDAAIDADTIDSREDTTLNWMAITVDEQGWGEIAEIFSLVLRRIMAVAAASCERLDGADGIPVVTGLAAFEAPLEG